MKRLNIYLVRVFSTDAAALFAVALVLVFLVQCLRIIDAASVSSQSFPVLLGQAALAMPPLAIVLLYVCLAIGLGRGLRRLQASRELHILHVSRRLPALWSAIAAYIGLGALAVLLLAHVVEPATSRQVREIRSSIAADLVGRTLRPNHFARIGSGVTVSVGGRAGDGEVRSFFADDNRDPEARRTYVADSAVITRDELGYVLQLRQGSIQYVNVDQQFTEISFDRYDIALDRLTGALDDARAVERNGSIELLQAAFASGALDAASARLLAERFSEGLRVIAIGLLVASLAAFPSGRRTAPPVPIELVVLGAAIGDRVLGMYLPVGPLLAPAAGSVLMLTAAITVLLFRFRAPLPASRRVHST